MKLSPSKLPKHADDLSIFTLKQSAADDLEGYPIFVKRQTDQKDTFPHEHVYYEVAIIEAGTADHYSAEGTRRLQAGDLIVVKPGVWHQYRNTRTFHIVNCLFDRRILIHQKMFFSLVGGAFDLFGRPAGLSRKVAPIFLHAQPAQHERLRQIIKSMILERREKLIDWEGALLAQLQDLIVILSRIHHGAHPGAEEELTPGVRDLCNEIIVYLEDHFRERVSLADLSHHFHASPSYLSRIFKRRMGLGLIEYVNTLRIEEACRLLGTRDWSITQIAGEVGYDEIAYFSRCFRKKTGKSASAYRNSHRL
jgi:AraC family L-rhamnose operon transcriptional activator RhaR